MALDPIAAPPDAQIHELLDDLLAAQRSPGTRASYASDIAIFLGWLAARSKHPLQLARPDLRPLPQLASGDDRSRWHASHARPCVRLRSTRGTSISAVIYALVERGVLLRPALAGELRGSVLMRLGDPYKPVRVDLCGGEIEVGDCDDDDRAHDLVIDGALHDVIALIASPLTGGLPRPTAAMGRAALARLADGRVELSGPLNLARGLLRLLSAMPESRRTATSPATSDRNRQIARR